MDDLDRELAGLMAAHPDSALPIYSAEAAARIIGNVEPKAFSPYFSQTPVPQFTATLEKHRKGAGNGAPHGLNARYEIGKPKAEGGRINYDARFNIGVFHNEQFIASVGFDPRPGHIAVSQIQGVPRLAGALGAYRWEDALLEQVIAWAEGANVPEVIVRGAKNNFWTTVPGHLRVEQAVKRYDEPAQRMGGVALQTGDYSLRKNAA